VGFFDILLQPVVEHLAVGQLGQIVEVGLMPDQFLGFFPLCGIGK
jgi:hypothetical protein